MWFVVLICLISQPLDILQETDTALSESKLRGSLSKRCRAVQSQMVVTGNRLAADASLIVGDATRRTSHREDWELQRIDPTLRHWL